MTGSFFRTSLALSLATTMAFAPVAPAFGQQQTGQTPTPQGQAPTPGESNPRNIVISQPDYTQMRSHWPNLIAPYSPRPIQRSVTTNSPTIQQLVQDGRLRLSLQEAVELALQNNIDLENQRYTPWLADIDILGSMAGGGNVPSFDPAFTSTLSADSRNIPINNPLISGTGTGVVGAQSLKTHVYIANFGYSQGFHTGTVLEIALNATRQSTSSAQNLFNPSVQTNINISFSQPLLRGFGLFANTSNIQIAKINKGISELTFKQQAITSVTAVANAYWELVFARGNVEVSQRSVDLAQKLYEDNQKQVEIGTLAPLEVVRAEAQLAGAQQALIAAQTVQLQDQIALMNLIAKNPNAPELQSVEIVPTESVTLPPLVEQVPLQEAITEAIAKRPDILQSESALQVDEISVRATRNALLPTLTLNGFYIGAGLAGRPRVIPGSPISPSTGLRESWRDMIVGDHPEFNAQFVLTIPIRNRAAQADNVRALLAERQDEMRYRQVLNNAVADVHNTQILLAQDRAAVEAAVKTRQLQEQTLDAEQKKLQLGASTIFQIVQDQRDLADAASAEVRALVDLAKAKVDFDRAMGRTLEVYNITISNALSGRPARDTLIPGTSTRGEIIGSVNRPLTSKSPAPAPASANNRSMAR